MAYIDGFVLVVPKENVAAYKAMAKRAGKVWRKHGALEYKECMGDDLRPEVPKGAEGMPRPISFVDLVKCKPGETVWFSFIVYKSRKERDRINAKVMKDFAADPKMKDMPMPFDMKRMAFGGFKAEVDV